MLLMVVMVMAHRMVSVPAVILRLDVHDFRVRWRRVIIVHLARSRGRRSTSIRHSGRCLVATRQDARRTRLLSVTVVHMRRGLVAQGAVHLLR